MWIFANNADKLHDEWPSNVDILAGLSVNNSPLNLTLITDALRSIPDFNNPAGGTLGILNAIQSVGGIVCLPYAPYLSDWIGRKKTIFVGCIYVALGAALQGGSQNIGMFIAGRIFSMSSRLTFLSFLTPAPSS